ncbi:MAG: hypothetical protein OXR68_04585 [Alphaproteobacteria bacterium]|nr:hypothetical protein [Alphaproteobacteria bacterium]MDD9919885.1 hypothetical protein [Alphaproteobacteria bacterium]
MSKSMHELMMTEFNRAKNKSGLKAKRIISALLRSFFGQEDFSVSKPFTIFWQGAKHYACYIQKGDNLWSIMIWKKDQSWSEFVTKQKTAFHQEIWAKAERIWNGIQKKFTEARAKRKKQLKKVFDFSNLVQIINKNHDANFQPIHRTDVKVAA